MSLALCVLASGSSGNCSLLRTPDGVVLVDAGVGPRSIQSCLVGTGVTLDDVRAIVLTHLDSDHFRRSWCATIVKRGIRVHCAAEHAERLEDDTACRIAANLRPFGGAFSPVDGVTFEPMSFAHDATGSFGFVIHGHGTRIGFATDLGRVTDELIDRFSDLDILAIESNYDPQMQRESGRPWFLQQRITGGRGHLSNEQALAAVKAVFDRHIDKRLPGHVVLLHRSDECNCPDLVRRLFARDKRIAPRLVLADHQTPTRWLCAAAGEPAGRQMLFAFRNAGITTSDKG